MAYNQDKGKGKQREFALRLRCFISEGLHLARECPKRKALNGLIKKIENEEEEACLGSMLMLGALQVMSKTSSQGSGAGKKAEVANPCGEVILKGKEKLVGKRGRTSGLKKMGTNCKMEARERRRWRLT